MIVFPPRRRRGRARRGTQPDARDPEPLTISVPFSITLARLSVTTRAPVKAPLPAGSGEGRSGGSSPYRSSSPRATGEVARPGAELEGVRVAPPREQPAFLQSLVTGSLPRSDRSSRGLTGRRVGNGAGTRRRIPGTRPSVRRARGPPRPPTRRCEHPVDRGHRAGSRRARLELRRTGQQMRDQMRPSASQAGGRSGSRRR